MAYTLSHRRTMRTLGQIICKLEHFLYLLIIVPSAAFLPASLAYAIACRRGDWVYRHDASARERIINSLEGIIGDELSYTERAQVTRDFFRRRSCEAIDMMHLAWRGRALARLVKIQGLEHIEAGLAAGKGVVLCSAHYGFFSGSFSLLGARGFPITVVDDQNSVSDPGVRLNELLFWCLGVKKRVARYRQRPDIIPGKGQVEAAFQIAEVLRSNEVIGVAIDVPIAREDHQRAVPVDFLGKQILLLPGIIVLAQITGSQVLTLIVRRSADWQHQSVEISAVPLDGDADSILKRCVAMVEAPIQQNPANWNGWFDPQGLVELGLMSIY